MVAHRVRTMDDPCNADPSQQQLLIPNPCAPPAAPATHTISSRYLPNCQRSIQSSITSVNRQAGTKSLWLDGLVERFASGSMRRNTPRKLRDSRSLGRATDRMRRLISCSNRLSAGPLRHTGPALVVFRHGYWRNLCRWERQRRCEDIVDPGIHADALERDRHPRRPWCCHMGDATGHVLQSSNWQSGGRRMN